MKRNQIFENDNIINEVDRKIKLKLFQLEVLKRIKLYLTKINTVDIGISSFIQKTTINHAASG